MTDPEIDPGWEDEMTAFLDRAAKSVTQSACLLRPAMFDCGIGSSLASTEDFITIFVKSEEGQEGYSLSLCLTQESAAKMITGLVAGYRHLYAEELDE